MQNTNDVQHIQTTITELRDMTDVIFAVEPIQPLGLIGAVGIAKTTSIKTWFRDAYAEHRGVSPDEVKIVHERVANRDAAEIAGVGVGHGQGKAQGDRRVDGIAAFLEHLHRRERGVCRLLSLLLRML